MVKHIDKNLYFNNGSKEYKDVDFIADEYLYGIDYTPFKGLKIKLPNYCPIYHKYCSYLKGDEYSISRIPTAGYLKDAKKKDRGVYTCNIMLKCQLCGDKVRLNYTIYPIIKSIKKGQSYEIGKADTINYCSSKLYGYCWPFNTSVIKTLMYTKNLYKGFRDCFINSSYEQWNHNISASARYRTAFEIFLKGLLIYHKDELNKKINKIHNLLDKIRVLIHNKYFYLNKFHRFTINSITCKKLFNNIKDLNLINRKWYMDAKDIKDIGNIATHRTLAYLMRRDNSSSMFDEANKYNNKMRSKLINFIRVSSNKSINKK